MRKIIVLGFLLMALVGASFAEAKDIVTGTVPETLFVNGINNVLVKSEAPIVEIEGTYYLPINPQYLSEMGLLVLWNETGTAIEVTGDVASVRERSIYFSDPYMVDYSRPIDLVKCSPVKVVFQGQEKLKVEAVYRNMWAETWYVPLSQELMKQLNWTYYDLGNYGDYLFLYTFTPADQQAFMAYQREINAMAKYMTIINKRLPIERAAYYVQLVKKTSQKYEVEDRWILAIMWQESWYDESCTYINAVGMMQMLKSTGKTMGVTPDQLLDPAINIDVCVKYLTRDRAYFDGDLEKAIHAYNQGSFRVVKNTHKTWYYEEVSEKYKKISAYLDKKIAGL